MNAVEHIAAQIKPEGNYNAHLEATLSLLNELTTENDSATHQCRVAGLNLQTKFKEIIRLCDDKPECLEMIQYSVALLESLFDDRSFGPEGNDKLVDEEPAER